ncbi:MAG: orotate phosphoribosyltransferase [Bryobacteraceae bacterium]
MSKTTDQDQLKEILCSKSLNTGREYELHSGDKSSVYVDAKITTCNPKAIRLVGRVFLSKIEDLMWVPEAVGGLTVGADPIAVAIARESSETDRPLQAFIVRKEPKKHGMEKFIEGLTAPRGSRVVIIDDVCTRGDSTAQAIETARDAGMQVLGAICLVDREQGASDLLRKRFGVSLARIFTLAELVSAADSAKHITEHVHAL